MNHLLLVFLVVAGMAALTYVCLPLRRHKIAATVTFMALSAGAFAAAIEMLGAPRPVALEWRNISSLPIVGISPNEEKREVYVWAVRDGMPIAYVYPWPERAGKLSELMDQWRRRQQTGDQFFLTGDMQQIARVTPPAPMPDKTRLPQ